LARAIRSILSNFTNYKFEIIVVNDGSTDKTDEIIDTFGNLIHHLNNKENFGLPYSLNRAIDASKGRYIIRLDADDFVNENYIQFHAAFLDLNNKYHAVRSDYLLIDEGEKVLSRVSQIEKPIGCAIMFRKEIFTTLGFYNEALRKGEEVCFLERFYKAGYRMGELNIALYRYRDTPNSLSKE
jgi:glycosyltransferase involved in cell wall biosynthesis